MSQPDRSGHVITHQSNSFNMREREFGQVAPFCRAMR